MPQHLTKRFEALPKTKKPASVRVHHARTTDRAYVGTTVCVLTFLDKKKQPRSIMGHATLSRKEGRSMTKRDGFRIATERAYKLYLKYLEELKPASRAKKKKVEK